MGLIDHLQELRWRILASLAFIAAATVAMYFASSWLLFWLDRPLGGLHLVAFGPVVSHKDHSNDGGHAKVLSGGH